MLGEQRDTLISGRMRSLNPDAYIHTLGPRYYKLRSILDEDNRWASLLEVLPYGDCNEIERLARAAGQRPNTSPAEVLLFRLASKGATVRMIKQWLREMQLEKALIVLEDDVPLRIVEQPCPYMEILEGKELLLICLAEGFPDPEYQWFKDNEENELEGQNRSTLRIPFARLDDSGIYVCRVHTFYMDGERDFAFSTFSRVEVVPSSVEAVQSIPHVYILQQQQPSRILVDPVEKENSMEDSQNLQISERRYESSSTVRMVDPGKKNICDLQIIKHPVSPGIVNQGSTVILECKARSSLPVHYQWYCSGIKMPGETSSELKLSNLYLDTYSGEYYICGVHTEAESLYSSSASVQLNGFDESTQYFASDKVALLIANNIYEELDDLIVPPNDVATLSCQLKSIDFKVIVLMNLNLIEMKKAVYVFCENLKKGSYGLVYYAGHGFEQFGQSYFQPVDASESCLPQECVCVEEILQNMQEKEPALSILLIDMCRKLPKPFREGENIQPGKIYEPMMKRNVVYGYATSFLCAAYESNKSPYGYFMKHLKEHITKKQSILDVLWRVKCDFENDPAVSKLQYPWVGSSLTARRKLTDPIIDQTSDIVADGVTWRDLQSSPFANIGVCLPYLSASIILEFHSHKEEFCNAADLYLYIEAQNEETYTSLCEFDVDFRFNLENISYNVVRPPVVSNDTRICCCITEIFEIQKIESDLTGTLRISNRQTGREIVKLETLHFVQPPISRLKCTEFWQRLHNTVIEDASHGLMMNIVLPNTCHVQNHYNTHYEDEDLISFSHEISTSLNASCKE